MIYKRMHKIGVDEVNKDFLMTNKAIIVSFQNTMSFYADSVHYGILDVSKTKLTWFIIDWKLEVFKRPKYGEEVLIKTWGRDADNSYMYVDFELYANNELYAIGTAKMVLFNLENKSFEIISNDILKIFIDKDNKSVFKERKLEHMIPLDKYENINKVVIRKSDLDFNNHVNNVKYFDYLLECSNIEYNNVRITYRKEIKENEEIYLYHSRKQNKEYYLIKDSDENIKTIIECY